jgi:hypothetical protein
MFKIGDKVRIVRNLDRNVKWYDRYIGQTAAVVVPPNQCEDQKVGLDLVSEYGGDRTYWHPEEVELVNIPKQLTFVFTD